MTDEYVPLPRKYRPRTWDDLVGQKHAVAVLKSSVTSGRVFSAYIFAGTAGSGKTSAARIFAMALNCKDLQDGSPCLKCPSCEDALRSKNPDIIEIDGPSYGRVEHIRDLRQRSQFSPHHLRTVFIIDEAHSLSRDAFEALLKILEEPPPHVVFILATTLPERITATIQSRSIPLAFRRHSEQDVVNRLAYVCAAESIDAKKGSLELIARYADGSLRDSVTVLDQLSTSHPGEPITADLVSDVLGIISGTELNSIMTSIIQRDPATLEQAVTVTLERTTEFGLIVRAIGDWYRDVLREKAGVGHLARRTDSDQKTIEAFARGMTYEKVDAAIRTTWELADRVRFSSNNPKAFFLTGLYRLMLLADPESAADLPKDTGPDLPEEDVPATREEAPSVIASFSGSSADTDDLEAQLRDIAAGSS